MLKRVAGLGVVDLQFRGVQVIAQRGLKELVKPQRMTARGRRSSQESIPTQSRVLQFAQVSRTPVVRRQLWHT